MNVTGSARRDGVSVEVLPGGALKSLDLTPEALRARGTGLAETILALVREAAAQADRRAVQSGEFAGLDDDELARLGLTRDESLSEAAEGTTPDSWRL
ncbi:YbaB/EbfC family nucleoid-associated protein [Amycolatopsis sp. NPDC059027]|uniref:YbaB/EbfC family nucleoid-associated protein n=1 Tax=unclassified Amycolatopsis TaxID=2618356 RepID=UPI003670B6DE